MRKSSRWHSSGLSHCRIPDVGHVSSIFILLPYSLLQAPLPVPSLPTVKLHKCPCTPEVLHRDPKWLPLCLPTMTESPYARTLFLGMLYTNKTALKGSQGKSQSNSVGKCRAKVQRSFHFPMCKKDLYKLWNACSPRQEHLFHTRTCRSWSHLLVAWMNLLLRTPGNLNGHFDFELRSNFRKMIQFRAA